MTKITSLRATLALGRRSSSSVCQPTGQYSEQIVNTIDEKSPRVLARLTGLFALVEALTAMQFYSGVDSSPETAAPKMSHLRHKRQVGGRGHLSGGNCIRSILPAALESDKVIKPDQTPRSEAGARAECSTVVIGVHLHAGRTRDRHRRSGSTAKRHIQNGRAGHGAREREEKTRVSLPV